MELARLCDLLSRLQRKTVQPARKISGFICRPFIPPVTYPPLPLPIRFRLYLQRLRRTSFEFGLCVYQSTTFRVPRGKVPLTTVAYRAREREGDGGRSRF